MNEVDDNALMVVTNFINLMDGHDSWLSYELSEDAVLDWFGRSVLGRQSIVSFIRMHFSRMQHTIDKIQRIPPINHRLLKYFESTIVPRSDKEMRECDQGHCQENVTPENSVCPDLEELAKAPHKKRHYQQSSTNYKLWQYLEIRGELELKQVDKEAEHFVEKNIRRIVLGYSDKIHFIVYEAKNGCRKKLSMFNS